MKTSIHTILENQKQFGLMYAELEVVRVKKHFGVSKLYSVVSDLENIKRINEKLRGV